MASFNNVDLRFASQNASTFMTTPAMTIKSTGNVGIGTTAPSTTFHAVGTSQAVGQFESNAADTWINLKNTTAGGYTWRMMSSGTGSGSQIGSFGVQNSSTNAGFYINSSGNATFGSGTGSPINVTDSNASAGGISLSIASANDATISMVKSGARRWTFGMDSTDSYKFKIATTTGLPNFATDSKFSIDGSGNVGGSVINFVSALDFHKKNLWDNEEKTSYDAIHGHS